MVLILVINPICSFSQDKDKLVEWSASQKLLTSHFTLEAPTGRLEKEIGRGRRSILEGFIFTGIDYSYHQINKDVSFSVKSFMDPLKSWIRDTTNKETLEHEQAHFNITEIYSRKIRRDLSFIKNANDAKKIYGKYIKELQEEQDRFDDSHHGEVGVEPEWQLKIENELLELENWSKTTFEILLK